MPTHHSSLVRLSGEIASGEQELNGHYGQSMSVPSLVSIDSRTLVKQRVSPDASRLISSKRISTYRLLTSIKPFRLGPETRIEMLKPRVSSSQKKLTATCVPAEEPGGQTDLCMHSYVNQPRYENQLPSDASVASKSPGRHDYANESSGSSAQVKRKLSAFRSSRSIRMPIDTIQKVGCELTSYPKYSNAFRFSNSAMSRMGTK